ncbi:biotin--[acetyl-CoA-carboxylase] ligase [Halarcobacter sp.]|uniref:biotin--[acetyl-CoA-carboxylase] ligase n=1 Tax=Halarcobacter sp. TaxID=2321133 RepID=UPI002AA6A137|nr:biotin--[acetyl-CoA-carboxylase] ligase [Halarcobacter sp.]
MKIIFLDEIDSTHTYLKELINKEGYSYPICISTEMQTNGQGSRGNSWTGKKGNLFFSFVLKKDELPKDLEIQSASIYFSFLLKNILSSKGSNLWLKWPNDFYIDNKKIGGTITTVTKDLIYCGIGLNLLDVSDEFGKLDIKIDKKECLEIYFDSLEKRISWKDIFSQFKIEFQKSRKFKATINNKKISLENAILFSDGSIEINNTRVFSLR